MGLRDEIRTVLVRELGRGVRYRTLLFQSGQMAALRAIESVLLQLDDFWPSDPVVIGHTQLFDDIGPLSAQRVLTLIRTVEFEAPIVLSGPLHICDCWPEEGRRVLWQHLAAFSGGVGIVVIDAPRNRETRSLFRTAGRLATLDAWYMKSRLSATEADSV